jgi:hypothetical protein
MTEREKFEKWVSGQNPSGYTGGHPWWFDSGLWNAWQAALSAAPTPPEVELVYQTRHVVAKNGWTDIDNPSYLHYQNIGLMETRILYTGQASNDELRSAAEEAYEILVAQDSPDNNPSIKRVIADLRSALGNEEDE